MQVEEIVTGSLARMMDWGNDFPSARMPMYRRISQRQQQLYSFASKANPDYYGRCAIGGFDAEGCLDLRDLIDLANLDQAAGIQFVEISDAGASVTVTAGEEVNIVSIADRDADVSPRVTLRDFIFRGVGTDLTGVISVKIFYPRIPDELLFTEDGTTEIELLQQHQELLIIDLTKDLLRKTMGMEPSVKTAAAGLLAAEEEKAMQDYLEDINAFAIGASHRFSEPPPTATR